MNVKIDVNINLNNIEAIIDRISKFMDLSRIDSSKLINLDDKSQSISTMDNDNSIKEEVKQIEEITIDKLRYLLTDLSKGGKAKEAKDILSKYNCTKVIQLKEEDYKRVYMELNEVKHKI